MAILNKTVSFDENERQIKRAERLKKLFPIMTLIVFLSLVLYPILASRENSFTLAIDKLSIRDEKAKLIKPSYVDVDRNNNPINITAATATREENKNNNYFFTDLIAQMSLPTGEAIEVNANNGKLNTSSQVMDLSGEIIITSQAGFLLRSTQATFLISEKIAFGKNGVSGIAPFGNFNANDFNADVEKETIILEGNVRIYFDPDKPMDIILTNTKEFNKGNNN
jgi:LPS export ABC transporter protein LptC|tara:strand:- start:23307 stop:23978 length:672 start_codon:yes stop_codon:yes gene_type:complete